MSQGLLGSPKYTSKTSRKTEATAGLVSRDYCSVVALSTTCFPSKIHVVSVKVYLCRARSLGQSPEVPLPKVPFFITIVGFVAETPLLSLVKNVQREQSLHLPTKAPLAHAGCCRQLVE